MLKLTFALTAALLCQTAQAQTGNAATVGATTKSTKYGNNKAAGATFIHDGVKLYYETYGEGEPLLIIHGNGSSIGEMRAQIDHFRKRFHVIAMDSRDHGKSADSPDALNYEKMTDDQAALLDHLKIPSANVLGWSDGGIEALLLALRHPTKVKKLAVMAANLYPAGATPEALAWVKSAIDSASPAERATPAGKRDIKVSSMMLVEPHIDPKSLEAITPPTLVLASDHDVVKDEHTLEIYHHLPNSQLCIFPNATHMIPYDDPPLFNSTVERFLRAPFVKKDRIQDFLKSIEAIKKSEK